jgi:hypothetical protein
MEGSSQRQMVLVEDDGGDGGVLRSFSVGEAAECVRVLTTGILIR